MLTVIFMVVCVNRYSKPLNLEEELKYTDFSGVYTVDDDYSTYNIPDNKRFLNDISEINFRINFDEDIKKYSDKSLC